MEIYQVKSGDTLSAIARDTLGDAGRWPEIAKLNNLVDTTIFPGQQLIIPEDEIKPISISATRRPDPRAPGADPVRTAPIGAAFNIEPMTATALALLAFFVLMSLGNDDG